MSHTQLNTIDDVIATLEEIIGQAEANEDPLGYFAVLYQKVTIKVKEGIATGYFENGPRMELLDIIFAKRYIDAYYAWQENTTVTLSWRKAFVISANKSMLVFQHLLLGMNAHINLDLGLAVTEITTKDNIHLLQNDFIKINEIISSLVTEVQDSLSYIWPLLKTVLAKTGRLDDLLVDFSMKIAREGAWSFANQLVHFRRTNRQELINNRDIKVSEKTKLITQPRTWVQFLLWIIRLSERGSVREKINKLKAYQTSPLPFNKKVSAGIQEI